MAGPADLTRIQATAAVAARGLVRLAEVTEPAPGRWRQAAAAAIREAGTVDPDGGKPSPRVIAATIGLGAIPRGQTRHEREIARAYMAFHRLLQSWSYWELNAIRRRTLSSTAEQIERAITSAQRSRSTSGPGVPRQSHGLRQ